MDIQQLAEAAAARMASPSVIGGEARLMLICPMKGKRQPEKYYMGERGRSPLGKVISYHGKEICFWYHSAR